MLIGVDFDNTIVCYDQLFHRVALEQGLIPHDLEVSKERVRDYLRGCNKEDLWTQMQGYVYGARINEAPPFPGALDFFVGCRRRRVEVCIVSHKTRYPFAGEQYDLHRAAIGWLEDKGLLSSRSSGLPSEQIFLELTKQDKLHRIADLGCTHFIDDLPEFLLEPEFPEGVHRILFDPNGNHKRRDGLTRTGSWKDIQEMLLTGSGPDL